METVAEAVAASPLFDGPVREEWARRFLDQPGHHMLLAHAGERPVGMVSGMELTHPDKGTEMVLYELSVDEDHRRRGIGRELVGGLLAIARERGCYGMWVAVDTDNDPALATYAAAGGAREADAAMIVWSLDGTAGPAGPAA
jgi:ribosomal protein S18 acetylase RimI-like enzyme